MKTKPQTHLLRRLMKAVLALTITVMTTVHAATPAKSVTTPLIGSLNGKAYGIPASATDPYLYSVVILGSGSSNLGGVRLLSHHIAHADIGSLVSGFLTMQTPSGAILGTYVGSEFPTDDPNIFGVSGTITFLSGTGKYVHATGNASFIGYLSIVSISDAGVFDEDINLTFNGSIITPR